MKRLLVLTLLFSLFASFTTPAFADIDSFKDSVEDANEDSEESPKENENKKTRTREKDPPPSANKKWRERDTDDRNYQNKTNNTASELLLEICCGAWILNNFYVSFEPYPYANDGKYICYNLDNTILPNTQFYRFSISTSGVYVPDIGYGNESVFEGYFYKCFGPLVENTVYRDAEEMTGDIKVGGQLALFQTSPFSLSVFMQWSHWYGELTTTFPSSGIAFGLHVRSFPFKPLVLEWRFGGQTFGDDYACLMESDLQIGAMIGRFELFCAWKNISVLSSSMKTKYNESNGITAGAKIYF